MKATVSDPINGYKDMPVVSLDLLNDSAWYVCDCGGVHWIEVKGIDNNVVLVE